MGHEGTTEHAGTTTSPPVCARHPDRTTWVSCGRCGAPLCPDCVHHGPVGIRCWECLHGKALAQTTTIQTDRIGALPVILALVGGLVLIGLGIATHSQVPNLLLAMVLGGLVGGLARRACGGCIRRVAWRLILLVAGVIALSGLVLLVVSRPPASLPPAPLHLLGLRTLATLLLGGFFTWLLAVDEL